MRDLPDGPSLLVLAGERAAADLDPTARRELAAKLERCRAIAAREQQHEGAWRELRAELQRLAPAATAEASFRALAQAIRAGRFDAASPEREAVRRLLWAITRQKLRESNPALLEQPSGPPPHSA